MDPLEELELEGRLRGARLKSERLERDLNDCLERLHRAVDMHRPVQWQGWRLWMQRAGHNRLAFCDRWCPQCRVPFPCSTFTLLTATHE